MMNIRVRYHMYIIYECICISYTYNMEEFVSYGGLKEDISVMCTGNILAYTTRETKSFSYSSPRASSNASSCGRLSPIPAVLGEPDWTPTYAPSYSPEQQLGTYLTLSCPIFPPPPPPPSAPLLIFSVLNYFIK